MLNRNNSYMLTDIGTDNIADIISNLSLNFSKTLLITRSIQSSHNNEVINLTKDISRPDILQKKILAFIKNNKNSLILLDRLEYLIIKNGFDKVLDFLYNLNDQIKDSTSTFLINVDQNILNSKELTFLHKEFQKIPKNELSEDLHQILSYISKNKKCRFTDIRKEFNISKTTVRQKISKLEKEKLIDIKKIGRCKYLAKKISI